MSARRPPSPPKPSAYDREVIRELARCYARAAVDAMLAEEAEQEEKNRQTLGTRAQKKETRNAKSKKV